MLVPLPELDTASLFAPLHAELMRLLRALAPEDWQRPTVAGAWRVRDVAMHLLDGDLRKLSAHRDGHLMAPDRPLETEADVLALINGANASGVAFGQRLSSAVIVGLLDITGRWVADFVEGLDPEAPALFPVAWAGERQSTNRFDTAREYTERWHHQMQMRSAIGADGDAGVLLAPRFARPLFDASVRVLPHAYREVEAADGTAIVLRVTDSVEASWTLRREQGAWRLYGGARDVTSASLAGSPDALWRLFYNAPMVPDGPGLRLEGDRALLVPLLRARSVMV